MEYRTEQGNVFFKASREFNLRLQAGGEQTAHIVEFDHLVNGVPVEKVLEWALANRAIYIQGKFRSAGVRPEARFTWDLNQVDDRKQRAFSPDRAVEKILGKVEEGEMSQAELAALVAKLSAKLKA